MSDVHANYSDSWQTPPDWIDWARDTMGGIDLDPCAALNPPANWFAELNYDGVALNGLVEPWYGRVYVNPPGSNSSRSVKAWWEKAWIEWGGRVSAITWCFFNNEHARHLHPSPFEIPGYFVIPSKRVAFMRDNVVIKSPRNWTWFWATCKPAKPSVESWILPTGTR